MTRPVAPGGTTLIEGATALAHLPHNDPKEARRENRITTYLVVCVDVVFLVSLGVFLSSSSIVFTISS